MNPIHPKLLNHPGSPSSGRNDREWDRLMSLDPGHHPHGSIQEGIQDTGLQGLIG